MARELGEIRTGPQTGLRLCRLLVRPQMWPGPAHTRLVADSLTENTELFSQPASPVWQFMSLIGLLTAPEKQVQLGLTIWDPFSGITPTGVQSAGGYQNH